MLVVQWRQCLETDWEILPGIITTMISGNVRGSQLPVLVKGMEKSCWRSRFLDVLRTTTTSAGRVSLFFSRTPEASYNTYNTDIKWEVSRDNYLLLDTLVSCLISHYQPWEKNSSWHSHTFKSRVPDKGRKVVILTGQFIFASYTVVFEEKGPIKDISHQN
jgi:hypothetical protein